MSDNKETMEAAGIPWCDVDKCPTYICNGPHREVKTSLGIEILREDQQPLGALPEVE